MAILNKNAAFPLSDKPIIVKYHFIKNEGQNAFKILIVIAQFDFFYYYSYVLIDSFNEYIANLKHLPAFLTLRPKLMMSS